MKTYHESKIKFTKLWISQNVKKPQLKSTSSVSICSYNSHGFENQSRYGDLENSLGRGNLQIEVVKNVKYFSKIRLFFFKLFFIWTSHIFTSIKVEREESIIVLACLS